MEEIMKKRHLFSRKTWLSVFTAITFMITEAFLCQPSVPKDVQAQEFTTAETLPVNTPVTDITGDNIKYYTFQSTEDGRPGAPLFWSRQALAVSAKFCWSKLS